MPFLKLHSCLSIDEHYYNSQYDSWQEYLSTRVYGLQELKFLVVLGRFMMEVYLAHFEKGSSWDQHVKGKNETAQERGH